MSLSFWAKFCPLIAHSISKESPFSQYYDLFRIAKYIEDFITKNVFQTLNNPKQAYHNLRHAVTMLKELSTAKENAFKNSQWPFELLKAQNLGDANETLKFRKKAL